METINETKSNTKIDNYEMVTGTNPILKMDYPDPDVIRVGNAFYMITTTMHFMPGAEILKSYDLINWEHETYIYDKLDSTDAQRLEGNGHVFGKGMWAATIRFHENVFYILFVCNDTQKTYLYKSNKGELGDENSEELDMNSLTWTKSTVEGFYHDASLLFDDGKIFIVYGNTDIYLTELNSEMTGPKPGGVNKVILTDKGNPQLGYEGSHLYKIDGRYYLFLIHSKWDRWRRVEACFMADTLEDLINGNLKGGDVFDDDMGFRNSGIAQGGIVEGPDGIWNAIMFQDSGAIGRIPVVVPVSFGADGYPVFGVENPEPEKNRIAPKILNLPTLKTGVEYKPLVGSDDFRYNPEETFLKDKKEYGSFGFKSMWQFSHEPDMDLVKCDSEIGCVWITTDKLATNIYHARNVLTQRMIFPECSAEVTLDVSKLKDGDAAGLVAFQGNYAWVGVRKEAGRAKAVMCSFTNTSGDVWNLSDEPGTIEESIDIDSDTIRLRLTAKFDDVSDFKDAQDVAICEIDLGQGYRQIGTAHQLTFRLDHFTGCRFGLFVYSEEEAGGSAGFLDFKYNK